MVVIVQTLERNSPAAKPDNIFPAMYSKCAHSQNNQGQRLTLVHSDVLGAGSASLILRIKRPMRSLIAPVLVESVSCWGRGLRFAGLVDGGVRSDQDVVAKRSDLLDPTML